VGSVKARSYFSYDANGYGGASFYSSYNYANGEGMIKAAGATNPTVFSPNGGVIIGPQAGNPPANGLLVGGNVGIGGITSPNSRLHVYATSTNSEIDIQSLVGAGNHWGMYSNLSDNSFRIWGGSDYMTFLRNGNVGIGTTNPINKFEVQASSTGSLILATVRNIDVTNASSGAGIIFQPTTAGWGPSIYTDRGGKGNSGGLYFGTTDAGGGSSYDANKIRMVINDQGNIGINTTNPGAYRLNVNGDTNITGSLNVTGTTTATAFIGPLTGTLNAANVSSGAFGANTGNGNYSFAGNVGIGTTTPGYELDVQDASAQVQIKSTTGTLYALLRINNTGGDMFIGRNNSAGNGLIASGGLAYSGVINALGTNPLQLAVNNAAAITILNGGNIGIGTTDPGIYRLKVSGDVAITGTLQTQTGSDFAEEFSVTENIPAGMVVVMADDGHKSVKVANKKYDRTVVGIVSDNPSIIAGKVNSDKKVVVAMMGVVSVNVSNRNGDISKGDLLTSSDVGGYAMKASDFRPGTVIGKALEDLSGKSGKIKVLVNLQ